MKTNVNAAQNYLKYRPVTELISEGAGDKLIIIIIVD